MLDQMIIRTMNMKRVCAYGLYSKKNSSKIYILSLKLNESI